MDSERILRGLAKKVASEYNERYYLQLIIMGEKRLDGKNNNSSDDDTLGLTFLFLKK